MSIAKKLQGGGGSFGALAQGGARGSEVLARSEALDATGRVRRASSAPVPSIVFNPLNPRKSIESETIDELAESLSRQQIVPITVVSRAAFLDAHPGQAEAIGAADFVALDGNRRLLAAQRAGLTTLRVDLNDDLVSSAADMVEAALVANAHREDVSPLEEAQAIQQLLDTAYDGNQAAVARKLGKSRVWVGQRLALLHLSPELQEKAEAGDLAIEDARKIGAEARAGRLSAAEQLERAEAAKKAAADKQVAKAAAKAARAARGPEPEPVERSGGGSGGGVARGEENLPEVNAVYTPPSATTLEVDSPNPLSDVNDVYTAALPDQRDAPEEHLREVAVQLNPSDPRASALAILSALDRRQAVQVASELLELLKREAGHQPS
ncbi:ParB/RepB/Spo0J family partition protein [Kitasatospora sp. RG8]|uniref:ParB/RepB/Spo0J family partition protein n=1 Tax=Kitasatospora sp. RG8 TaxID=2820815 RepID=UPI001ADEE59B|nr:ParB/RepB/Spo0J family partition protein [Kitasatospora sp. RG8]MBP0454002.1 ParB/RepB/Spo0J family partition protein [Kitasatospora sp. RG8]